MIHNSQKNGEHIRREKAQRSFQVDMHISGIFE